MAVKAANTCVCREEEGGLWNTMELSIRKNEMKTNKKELKHMCKYEMKGRMGAGVACPVRPSIRSNRCLLSVALWCVTQTKRNKPHSFQVSEILHRLNETSAEKIKY